MTEHERRWTDAERILCVRLDNLGDVLMTTPAIRALKHGLPDRDGKRVARAVTLLGSSAGCAVARHVPEIDDTLRYDAPWVAAGRDAALDGPDARRVAVEIATRRFDAAVIFTCYTQSALPAAMLCAQAGIPLRLAHCRENPYALLSDWIRDPEPDGGIRHEVERQIALVSAVGAVPESDRLSMRVEPGARERVAMTLALRGIDPLVPYLLVHPGATAASRRWPPGRFGEVAAALVARTGMPVVISGSPEESALAAEVCDAALAATGSAIVRRSIHNLCGAFAIDDLAALIDRASVLISNNSGPVHIAAARGTPVVDIYALTNPQHTPWRVEQRVLSHDVPCRNCLKSVCPEGHHACLTGVPVAAVVEAAIELLDADEVIRVHAVAHDVPDPVAC